MKKAFYCLFYIFGIYISYLIYGWYQEKINITNYGNGKQKFINTSFLLFFQSLINFFFAWIVMIIKNERKDITSLKNYFFNSTFYMLAMFTSNKAIQYSNFPTMVLAKSCKPLSVLFGGKFINRHHYNRLQYISILLIIIGISLFMFQQEKSKEIKNHTYFHYGIILLITSLIFDGVSSAFQDKIVIKYNPTSYHLMYANNLLSSILLFIMLVITGDGYQGIQFCLKYPEFFGDILIFSFSSAFGQNFIYLTVVEFGSLICSLITTTRKFFTLLFSVIWFGHSVTLIQWFSIFIVFLGLGLDRYNSYLRTKYSHPKLNKKE